LGRGGVAEIVQGDGGQSGAIAERDEPLGHPGGHAGARAVSSSENQNAVEG